MKLGHYLLAATLDAPEPSSRRFRRLPSGWVSSFSALLSASPLVIEIRVSSPLLQVQAFAPVDGATMPSADFCNFFLPPLSDSSSWQSCRPPRVMRTHLHAYVRRIYAQAFRTGIGLWRYTPPHPACTPHMRFLFVEPALCLRLPSDSTSRWTPLPSG